MPRGKKNETVGLYPILLAQEIHGINNDKNDNKCNSTNKR